MTRGHAKVRRPGRKYAFPAALCSALAGLSLLAAADEPPAKPAGEQEAAKPAADNAAPANPTALGVGTLIKVPLPLTGNTEARVRDEINRYLKKLSSNNEGKGAANRADQQPTLVLELSPGQSEFGHGTNFGVAYDLAEFVSGRKLDGVRTVAYVPRTIKGHGVLIAMACQSLVMAPDAEIGEAGIDEEVVQPVMRSGYTEISGRHNTIPTAIALTMLDKTLKVYKIVLGGTAGGGTKFVLEKDLPDEEKKAQILSKEEIPAAGHQASFSARDASPAGLGFASFFSMAKDRATLAEVLKLPLEAVRERPSGEWRAKKIKLSDAIDGKVVDSVTRSLQDEVNQNGTNFILFMIETRGGSPADTATLANYIAQLDPSKVQTVAYIDSQAPSEAAFIALACDHIVMKNGATIGGPGNVALNQKDSSDLSAAYRGRPDAGPNDADRGIAKRKDRSWSVGAAMVDPSYRVFRFTRPGGDYYYSPEEVKERGEAAAGLKQGEEITQPGALLKLSSEQAAKLGLVETVPEYSGVLKMYGLESDPPAVEPGWVVTFIRALAHPEFAWILLMIGGGAFLMELHSPGVGLGGFIAFLCFLIYFWGQYLNGTAGWLEVLLFVSGVICLLIELFVIPGAAIFGLGGGLMIVASLILASQTFVIPRSSEDFEHFRDMLVSLAAAGAGIIGIAVVSRRFLHRAPGFNRMLLEPPTETEIEQTAQREALVDYRRLLGKQGVTATPLAPAGKARFNDELIDVLSQGEFIDRDVAVVVSDVQGNRVTVKRPEAES